MLSKAALPSPLGYFISGQKKILSATTKVKLTEIFKNHDVKFIRCWASIRSVETAPSN